jgi:hypothetical protein
VDAPAPASAIDALRRDVLGGLVALEERVRHHIAEELAQTRRQINESTAETRHYIDERVGESTSETRRYFGVVAESLMTKMELLAEGVRANGERLDRFQGEVHDQFARVDRRLLRLEARLTRQRRR